jgi:hypothetical protein
MNQGYEPGNQVGTADEKRKKENRGEQSAPAVRYLNLLILT